MPTLPISSTPAPLFEQANQAVLEGQYLDSNPHLQSGVLDPMRRAAEQTYADQRARLGELASQGGGGAYGGDMYQNLAARMYAGHQQQLGEQQNAALAGNYQFERSNMMEALRNQAGFETAGLDRRSRELISRAQNETSIEIANINSQAQERAAAAAARARAAASAGVANTRLEAARINADLQRELQSGQLDFARQQLALDAMNSLSRNNLEEAAFLASLASDSYAQNAGMMNLAGGLGTSWGNQALGGFGLAPGLENAGYTGYGAAFGAAGNVASMDASAAAHATAINNQNAQNAWEYGRHNPQSAYDDYLRSILAIASAGGTSDIHGMQAGTPAPPPTSPWLAGLGAGLGTYGALGGTFPWGGGGGKEPGYTGGNV